MRLGLHVIRYHKAAALALTQHLMTLMMSLGAGPCCSPECCTPPRRRRIPALRAVVVLPTRDLASQVYRVLARMCPAVGLTVGLMAGKANEVGMPLAVHAR